MEEVQKFRFFSHRECEYFPCHANADPEHFNCLFCWCPLYTLGEQCGGNFSYTDGGVKDCSACLLPHNPASYDYICGRFSDLIEKAKKPSQDA